MGKSSSITTPFTLHPLSPTYEQPSDLSSIAISSLCGVLISNCKWRVAVRTQYTVNVWFQYMYSQKWNCASSLVPKKNYNILFPNFHIQVFVSICIFPGSVCQIGRLSLGIYKSLTYTWMYIGIGNEAAHFHFWEYINQIFGKVHNIQYMTSQATDNPQISSLAICTLDQPIYIECVHNWSPLNSFPSPTPHSIHPI